MSTEAAATTRPQRINIQQHGTGGLLWFAAWLFTIGALKLTFWQGVLAVVIWPYYLGVRLAGVFAIGAS
jgi:hypothetical protein